jgi:hypothetical protein
VRCEYDVGLRQSAFALLMAYVFIMTVLQPLRTAPNSSDEPVLVLTGMPGRSVIEPVNSFARWRGRKTRSRQRKDLFGMTSAMNE